MYMYMQMLLSKHAWVLQLRFPNSPMQVKTSWYFNTCIFS